MEQTQNTPEQPQTSPPVPEGPISLTSKAVRMVSLTREEEKLDPGSMTTFPWTFNTPGSSPANRAPRMCNSLAVTVAALSTDRSLTESPGAC